MKCEFDRPGVHSKITHHAASLFEISSKSGRRSGGFRVLIWTLARGPGIYSVGHQRRAGI